jgi:hypothetical protein
MLIFQQKLSESLQGLFTKDVYLERGSQKVCIRKREDKKLRIMFMGRGEETVRTSSYKYCKTSFVNSSTQNLAYVEIKNPKSKKFSSSVWHMFVGNLVSIIKEDTLMTSRNFLAKTSSTSAAVHEEGTQRAQ